MGDPRQSFVTVAGIRFCVYQWNTHQIGLNPTLVMSHAAGFHARCWDYIVEQFPDFHVVAMDLRGHGQSGGDNFEDWFDLAEDLANVLAEMGVRGAIGIGHSLGACCSAAAAARNPGLFERLLLIDPVILSPEDYTAMLAQYEAAGRPTHFAAKRRADFASLEEFSERIRSKDPYSDFHPQVFRDFCRYAVTHTGEGDAVTLACEPAFEAKIYEAGIQFSPILSLLPQLSLPVMVVRVQRLESGATVQDFNYSPTWTELAGKLQQGSERYLPQYTHFLPLQAPEEAVSLIREFLP